MLDRNKGRRDASTNTRPKAHLFLSSQKDARQRLSCVLIYE
jgi:hypothetical protein